MINKLKAYLKFLKLKNKLNNSTVKKLNIGSGPDEIQKEYNDWVCTDIQQLDITKVNSWQAFLGDIKLDNILAEHVWEHLNEEQTIAANQNCYNNLRKGGTLRLAVPDGFHQNKDYIDSVKPLGHGLGSMDHKILYNYQIMKKNLEFVGFKVSLLEYWDENGHFNKVDFDYSKGYIKRCFKNDPRNKNGHLGYTSLIVDAIK
jgi:predicted SAM-dependent methyltransferase